jgi:FHS family glucose/mannose:H+ symporter-like MFS transporter
MGTVLLGPILPTLSHTWHLTDSQAGLLLFAKFLGAFVGGATVPTRLRNGILFGLIASFVGFGSFAFAQGLLTGALALFLCGIGLGQIIASTNILAGRRYRAHTGSALSIINFFWSLGAVTTGLFVAAFLPHRTLSNLLAIFAGTFLVVALGGWISRARLHETVAIEAEAPAQRLPREALYSFGLMLFLYGGLETCLSQWIPTYTLRYSTGHFIAGQSALVLLWLALTTGRALTSVVLRSVQESTLQRLGLLCSAILIPILAKLSSATSISICCILLGLSLSPFFPSTFAILMRRRPPAREAGFILAVSGLGAAALSWLMGQVSTHAGSLRIAMAVPFFAAIGLLAISFWKPATDLLAASTIPIPTPAFPNKAGV